MSQSRPLLTLILLAISLTLPSHAAIVLIHGSFSANGKWHRPRGGFYEALRASTDEAVISFSWSGRFLPHDIISDTGYLAELLLALDNNEPITIVAHSNGGNLCLYATLLLKELFTYHAQLNGGNGTVRSPHNIPSRLLDPFRKPRRMGEDEPDVSIHECVSTCFERLKKQVTKKNTLLTRPHFIKALYLMGTPFDPETFPLDMDIVEHAYNLYSVNDFVQAFAGNRHLPDHERTANLHVNVTNQHRCEECVEEEDQTEEHSTLNPCHGCLHAPLIGQWFLQIPKLIKTHPETTGVADGEVWFHHTEAPQYHPCQVPLDPEISQSDQDFSEYQEDEEDLTIE